MKHHVRGEWFKVEGAFKTYFDALEKLPYGKDE